jgi:hypothetical protein
VFKYLIQIALFMSFSLGLHAEVFNIDYRFLYENSSNALTIVEVIGTLKGSGVIVYLDDRPVILTNSHILQGRPIASVSFPEAQIRYLNNEGYYHYTEEIFKFSAQLPVIFDDPLHDFVFLKLEDYVDARTYKTLKMLAKYNGKFCQKLKNCSPGWHMNDEGVQATDARIAAIIDGKRLSTPLITSLSHKSVNDQMISGETYKALSLPVYARPGSSGGAYFYRGILTGLVTKVSLIGVPETYAISLDEIGKIISLDNSNTASASWKNGSLTVIDNGEEITTKSATNGGGETGNGGGETGNGGDGLANSKYWKIAFYHVVGKEEFSTWNPFVHRTNTFVINDKEYAFSKVGNAYQLPTIASYLWNKNHHKKQIFFEASEKNFQLLEDQRHKPIEGAVCGRTYDYYPSQDLYVASDAPQTTPANDGTLFILPNSYGIYPRTYTDPGRNRIFVINPYWKDKEGYYRTPYTAAKKTPGLLLDLTQMLGINLSEVDSNPQQINISASLDLKEIKVAFNNYPFQNLHRLPTTSASSILFSSDDGQTKAAYLYDTNDLSRIERIYIQHAIGLIEVGPCESFSGVK